MFVTQFERTPRVQFSSDKPARTEQSHAKACDINLIMKRYEKTGIIAHAKQYAGHYGDFTGATDYQECIARVQEADEAFMSLPASIRKRFDNDPGLYFDFATNPANHDELVKLGLLQAEMREETPVSEPEIQEKI